MEFKLKPGLKGERDLQVTFELTAANLGSGGLEVFATPAMAALMEGTAYTLVQEFLPQGYSSVGTRLEIEHLAATPIGMRVTATAELQNIEGRQLTFSLEVKDEKELVGRGSHDRVVLETEKFLHKVHKKLG